MGLNMDTAMRIAANRTADTGRGIGIYGKDKCGGVS